MNLSRDRLAWCSDPHLDHAQPDVRDQFIEDLNESSAGGLVITGDIAEADSLHRHVNRLHRDFDGPIWFVLGNHDFYKDSVASVRSEVTRWVRHMRGVDYLTDSAAVPLADGVYLVGEDGWGDATCGEFDASPVRLQDFVWIRDFSRKPPDMWRETMDRLGRQSATRLRPKLNAIPAEAKEIIVATHVPPFRESCWYEGQTTDDDWAPFFVCGHVGDVLRSFAGQRPATTITVLCGHTHHGGVAPIANNLTVHTASADYGRPTFMPVP